MFESCHKRLGDNAVKRVFVIARSRSFSSCVSVLRLYV